MKKRNPTDATMRNESAREKRITALARRLARLEAAVKQLRSRL